MQQTNILHPAQHTLMMSDIVYEEKIILGEVQVPLPQPRSQSAASGGTKTATV
jgi:hypothetical protein